MDRTEMSNAVKKVAWAYIILHLHINIFNLDILADWWGYLLIIRSLDVFSQAEESAQLIKPIGKALMIISAVEWVMKFLMLEADIFLLTVIISVISLYFHFQLLTNIADIALRLGCEEEKKIRRFVAIRTIAIAFTFMPLEWVNFEWMVYAVAVIQLAVTVRTCILLFCLSESIAEENIA